MLHGWKSVTNAADYYPYHFDPRPDAARFEPGTPSVVGAAALGAAVDLLLEVGPAVVERRILDLNDRFAAGLRARGADILSPWQPERRSGILVFRLGDDPDALAAGLRAHGVTARVRSGGVRVAPHFYQDEEDVERFFAALDRAR